MANKTSNAPPTVDDDLLAYNRYVAVTSAAFEMQEVTLLSMIGVEQLGEPFRYDVRVVCRKRIRNFTKVVGQPLTVGLKLTDGSTRYFNGIVRNFSYVGLDYTRRPIYLAEVVPWIAVLEFRRNSRIFQNMTSLEIAKQIFAEHKASDYKDLTQATPPKRVFCVQYDETDYAFVSRLLEQDGIYYYFVHETNRHELVLADSATAHKPCKPQVIPTNLTLEHHKIHDDIIWEWGENVSLRPGQVAMNDYDHEKPRANLNAEAPVPPMKTGGVPTLAEERAFDRLSKGPSGEQQAMTNPGPDAAQRELYFYPGRYTEKAAGDFYAKVRSEEIGCRAYRVRVTGGARQLCPGNTFVASNPYEITDTEIAPKPTDSWLAVRAEIDIRGETDKEAGPDAPPPYTLYADAPPAYTPTAAPPPYTPRPASPDDEPYLYHCTVEAQPSGNQFRPPLRTPRPVISGPQTAVVVGRPGETITTDKYGRIKVQFFWDRKGKKDENSSCWIRVAQNWAGKNFGGLVTPRVGQEVVVEFINGNPDWPLVTGCVYNDDNMPPEDLPASATRSTFKSRSVDGPATDFNEMRFEDKAGQEEVYVKAKKDMNLEVLEKFNIHVPNQTIPAVPSLQSATEGSDDSGTGSNITVTKDEITLVFANAVGIKSGIIINKDGIFLIGAPNIGVLCEGIVTITPIPIPRPSKAVLEAAGEMNMPPAFIAAMKLMP